MFETDLILDGNSVIRYCTLTSPAGSFYTEDIQMIFVQSGSVKLSCGRESYDLQPNQIALLKKNSWIEYSAIESKQLRYLLFTIKPSLIKEFLKLTDLPGSIQEEEAPITTMTAEGGWPAYILSLEPFLQGAYKPQPGLIKIKLLELLFQFSTANHHFLSQLMHLRASFRPNITETVEENILSTMTIEQLATLSGRSLSSFRRDFTAIYHMSPSEWIKLKRLEKAREMLSGTTLTVTEICYSIGFAHIAHFSRVFKSHFGFPPSYLRQHL
ncbi:MAG: helix-turn-helix transcriptional regulator [Bacteroidetes bacterium]|nr:helix-turn-helix transcriptional regulator [Bacteroidota bacterium]